MASSALSTDKRIHERNRCGVAALRETFKPHTTARRRHVKLKIKKRNMDYGHVKIGDITTKASTDDIRKLKFILDRHRIYHIIDGVTYFHPHAKAVRLKENHQERVRKVDATQDRSLKRKSDKSNHLKFRKLIAPDLYKLNYMNLIFFDSEEADFLATLVYKNH
ncbi:MAG: hypothetical protein PVI76_11870 [Desulfobacterales bacterium]